MPNILSTFIVWLSMCGSKESYGYPKGGNSYSCTTSHGSNMQARDVVFSDLTSEAYKRVIAIKAITLRLVQTQII